MTLSLNFFKLYAYFVLLCSTVNTTGILLCSAFIELPEGSSGWATGYGLLYFISFALLVSINGLNLYIENHNSKSHTMDQEETCPLIISNLLIILYSVISWMIYNEAFHWVPELMRLTSN